MAVNNTEILALEAALVRRLTLTAAIAAAVTTEKAASAAFSSSPSGEEAARWAAVLEAREGLSTAKRALARFDSAPQVGPTVGARLERALEAARAEKRAAEEREASRALATQKRREKEGLDEALRTVGVDPTRARRAASGPAPHLRMIGAPAPVVKSAPPAPTPAAKPRVEVSRLAAAWGIAAK